MLDCGVESESKQSYHVGSEETRDLQLCIAQEMIVNVIQRDVCLSQRVR